MNKQKKKLPLAMQIFIALILAIVVGLLMQSQAAFTENYIKPFGTIFLNLLKFIVVPIVLFSIMCGIISMKDIKKSRYDWIKNSALLHVHHSICNYDRFDWWKYFSAFLSGDRNHRSGL